MFYIATPLFLFYSFSLNVNEAKDQFYLFQVIFVWRTQISILCGRKQDMVSIYLKTHFRLIPLVKVLKQFCSRSFKILKRKLYFSKQGCLRLVFVDLIFFSLFVWHRACEKELSNLLFKWNQRKIFLCFNEWASCCSRH